MAALQATSLVCQLAKAWQYKDKKANNNNNNNNSSTSERAGGRSADEDETADRSGVERRMVRTLPTAIFFFPKDGAAFAVFASPSAACFPLIVILETDPWIFSGELHQLNVCVCSSFS